LVTQRWSAGPVSRLLRSCRSWWPFTGSSRLHKDLILKICPTTTRSTCPPQPFSITPPDTGFRGPPSIEVEVDATPGRGGPSHRVRRGIGRLDLATTLPMEYFSWVVVAIEGEVEPMPMKCYLFTFCFDADFFCNDSRLHVSQLYNPN
jgi:hypothetical protein